MSTILSLRKLFAYYRDLAGKAIAQVQDEDLPRVVGEYGNSLSVVMRRIVGNAHWRFADLLATDGEKPWRDREAEFPERPASREEPMAYRASRFASLLGTWDGLSQNDHSAWCTSAKRAIPRKRRSLGRWRTTRMVWGRSS